MIKVENIESIFADSFLHSCGRKNDNETKEFEVKQYNTLKYNYPLSFILNLK